MIAKGCPRCDQQVPVACKACPCGHSFFNARRTARGLSPGDFHRRTQRVQREKPNYYDALEYDKQIRKTKLRNSKCDDEHKKDLTKSKRRRIKKEDEEDDDTITPETTSSDLETHLIYDFWAECYVASHNLSKKVHFARLVYRATDDVLEFEADYVHIKHGVMSGFPPFACQQPKLGCSAAKKIGPLS